VVAGFARRSVAVASIRQLIEQLDPTNGDDRRENAWVEAVRAEGEAVVSFDQSRVAATTPKSAADSPTSTPNSTSSTEPSRSNATPSTASNRSSPTSSSATVLTASLSIRGRHTRRRFPWLGVRALLSELSGVISGCGAPVSEGSGRALAVKCPRSSLTRWATSDCGPRQFAGSAPRGSPGLSTAEHFGCHVGRHG